MLFKNNIVLLCTLAITAALCLAAIPHPTDYTVKWMILKECKVIVNGRTNINRFTCSVAGYGNEDTLTCFIGKRNNGTVVMNGSLELPVSSFDCANTVMTKDLRKVLKEKVFPAFYIHFISMERYPALKSPQENITGSVSIELAGVKKQLEVNYRISRNDQGVVEMTGEQTIHFSDFNLVAPRKWQGMIKVNDMLTVAFTIHCRIIDN